jgi:hypothetical protein
MLRPYKHAHPDKTVVALASTLLKKLRDQRLSDFDSLSAYASNRLGLDADALFLPALSFLYLLGLVEYHQKTDSIEYVGQ